jgi:tetratricopeptide (TPR) repeat protein
VNRSLIKAKPAFHRKTFLKPLHRTPEFCGACHKVHLPEALNGYRWLRGQNHYDSFLLSGVSGHGASSFYYPEQAEQGCNGCHMPTVVSDDFGARRLDDSGELKVHDHQFPSANTAIPHLLGLPDEVNDAHRRFLEGSLRVDIFGLREGGRIDGRLSAPLRPGLPTLEPGREYLLETVLRTLRLGHLFTQGTADSNQVWVEVTASSAGRVIGRSGATEAGTGRVDPWSHFVNAWVIDREGRRIDRRNAEDIFTALYNHQIPPGAADVVHYRLRLPEWVSAPVEIEVRLNYRKFDTTYVELFQGDAFPGNDLPITVIATDRIVLPVAGGAGVAAGAAPDVPEWQRWNDYGIGLLRKSGAGQLRQAEEAFAAVEALGESHGPLNLARVYQREGRLDEAAAALDRALSFDTPAYPWTVAYFTALIDRQNGYLDEAIAGLRSVVETRFQDARDRGFDFSRDYRALNLLADTLVERSKTERGPARVAARDRWLGEAAEVYLRTLALDPENAAAHYGLAQIFARTGRERDAEVHRELHARYKTDDNARDRAIALARRRDPAANHAAEAVVIYDLQRAGAFGLLPESSRIARQ